MLSQSNARAQPFCGNNHKQMSKPSCSQDKPKVVLNFESVDEIHGVDIHRSYWAVLSLSTVTLYMYNKVVLTTVGSVDEVLRGHCN